MHPPYLPPTLAHTHRSCTPKAPPPGHSPSHITNTNNTTPINRDTTPNITSLRIVAHNHLACTLRMTYHTCPPSRPPSVFPSLSLSLLIPTPPSLSLSVCFSLSLSLSLSPDPSHPRTQSPGLHAQDDVGQGVPGDRHAGVGVRVGVGVRARVWLVGLKVSKVNRGIVSSQEGVGDGVGVANISVSQSAMHLPEFLHHSSRTALA